MSKFNRIYLGEARAVVEELEDTEATTDELRVALINALNRIHKLEEQVDSLQRITGHRLAVG